MAIDSSDSYIDPQAVIVEADEYEDSIACKQEEIDMVQGRIDDLDPEDEDYDDELSGLECERDNLQDELTGLEEEAEDIFELRDDCNFYARGETLISEDVWDSYVRQLAEDIEGIDLSQWPYNRIDWDAAANDLLVDYTTITFRGQDFYVRS